MLDDWTETFSRLPPTLAAMDYKSRLQLALQLGKMDRKTLAAGIGLSVQAVGQVLLGHSRALTAENSAKAARALGVDGYWLATGEGEARPPLMAERDALSDEAVAHAVEFDKLGPSEKRLWRTLVLAARSADDDRAEEHLPPLPRNEAYEALVLKTPVKTTRRKAA